MKAVIKQLAPLEIRTRLEEIDRLERAHCDRNLDAELAAVLRDGGDVDAVENAQLDAERTARRLRAERAALTAELPDAVRREGQAQLVEYLDQHRRLAADASELSEKLCNAGAAFKALAESWHDMQNKAHEATRKAAVVAQQSGAPMPDMGTFQSKRISRLLEESRNVQTLLAHGLDQMTTVMGVQGRRLD